MTEDRRAVVIGGAGGIGSDVCRKLALLGYRVVVADFDEDGARKVMDDLSGSGHEVARLDVTRAESVHAALLGIEASGPASVLVVASGGPVVHLGQRTHVATLGKDDWDRTIALNLTGVFCCVQAFAQLRLATPMEHSRIILIGSAAGELAGNGTDIAYGTAKAALLGLTRQAAFDLAAAGITVNNVAPGPVGTPEFFRNTNEQIRAGIASLAALKRIATPEEVSAGVAYLASREAACITGATLAINGGIHMH
ncbi:NAD(P)-dependent dehydrogenase (short-subunit alcohol dehydrogenase family) [Rhodoferax ferrireducens]|uniref:NAD(P)-dependent dehydrogenase (Short-subunit alcohol dehydrogenase family) n=1 Tax=Rhodoferax ferrireducens TaxID=192843 RepID=A0ABU2CD83_9BURK|nr:SDR family oxidoreductase [Rhodoferax ferrireducens]MDR7379297.1 NAD(P)-dependent dehydrogenase (short-subunit alcohol dehydrogenase family) [Rhodoferax ferrireducens]